MKKIILFVTLLALVVSMTACGGGKSSDENSGDSTAASVEDNAESKTDKQEDKKEEKGFGRLIFGEVQNVGKNILCDIELTPMYDDDYIRVVYKAGSYDNTARFKTDGTDLAEWNIGGAENGLPGLLYNGYIYVSQNVDRFNRVKAEDEKNHTLFKINPTTGEKREIMTYTSSDLHLFTTAARDGYIFLFMGSSTHSGSVYNGNLKVSQQFKIAAVDENTLEMTDIYVDDAEDSYDKNRYVKVINAEDGIYFLTAFEDDKADVFKITFDDRSVKKVAEKIYIGKEDNKDRFIAKNGIMLLHENSSDVYTFGELLFSDINEDNLSWDEKEIRKYDMRKNNKETNFLNCTKFILNDNLFCFSECDENGDSAKGNISLVMYENGNLNKRKYIIYVEKYEKAKNVGIINDKIYIVEEMPNEENKPEATLVLVDEKGEYKKIKINDFYM